MNPIGDTFIAPSDQRACPVCGADYGKTCREPSGRIRRAGLHGARSLLGGILHGAIRRAIIDRPNTAAVIRATGQAFADSVRASLGKGPQ